MKRLQVQWESFSGDALPKRFSMQHWAVQMHELMLSLRVNKGLPGKTDIRTAQVRPASVPR